MATVELVAVKGLASTTPTFREKLVAGAQARGIDPSFLAAVISFESIGTFRADIRNPLSRAVGLIQFTVGDAAAHPAQDGGTAGKLGTSGYALAAMSPETQLDYVFRYFDMVLGGRKISSLADTYMAVLAPVAIGRGGDFPLYVAPSLNYTQNKSLDRDGDGRITAREASGAVQGVLNAGLKYPPICVAVLGVAARLLGALLLVGLGAAGVWLNR